MHKGIRVHSVIHPSEEKFKQLVLYVSRKCETDPTYGATKLNKILFYADFLAYLELGKPITGMAYQKLGRGPAPRALLKIKQGMIKQGAVVEVPRDYFGKIQKRLVPIHNPDLSGFKAEEISLVDSIIQALWEKTAEDVSALSHLEAGWELTAEGQDIPYEAVFIENRKPSSQDIEWARNAYSQLAQ